VHPVRCLLERTEEDFDCGEDRRGVRRRDTAGVTERQDEAWELAGLLMEEPVDGAPSSAASKRQSSSVWTIKSMAAADVF
jgi:hypothetical protein